MNRSNVEEIKARLPVEEVVGQYVKLEKAGKSLRAKCPFHHEKTASFYVSPDRGGYYCFGCGAKGDIFSFVEHFEGLDFKGALKVLAERAGITLTHDIKADSERDRLFQIMEAAAKYFEEQYFKSTDAKEYIKKRGVTDKTRQEFRIGWAPEGWRNLYDYLKAQKWPEALIVKAGLAKAADEKPGTFYDRFRGRVMFPLCDSSGRVIAFSGRILKADDQSAKYLNSPDTPLFDKSSVLYGLDKAKGYIRRLDYSILVEGQMDLIMSHQAGVKNTVAASGTALSDVEAGRDGVINNLGLLRRLSGNTIVAFDSDPAGRKAAMRAAAIGLSLDMNIKVADIQGGKDPADLVANNPEDWKVVLREAKHVVEFEFNNIKKEYRDNPGKLRIALQQRAYPLILEILSRTIRDNMVRMIADQTGVPEEDIREDLKVLQKRKDDEAHKSTEASAKVVSKTSAERASRIDLVERRMFGLLALMDKAGNAKVPAYRAQIEKIAGNTYDARLERLKPLSDDMLFEAEAFFGDEAERWDVHMADLVGNFELDAINGELLQAMTDLRKAEKAGDQATLAELAKKCQVLSIRKAEVTKRMKA